MGSKAGGMESNYDTINRSFMIAQNSDRLKSILNSNNLNLNLTSLDSIFNNSKILPYLLNQQNEIIGQSHTVEEKQSGGEIISIKNKPKPDPCKQSHKEIKLQRDPNSKYPLEASWCFWFFKNNRENQWKDNLILLSTVDYVEDFWSVYNHLKPVEYMSDGCDYMLFKKGIEPMWEDKRNENGGRWLLNIEKRSCTNFLNSLWLNSLLSLIGSHYDDETSYVNGVVLNKRLKTNKIALWTNNYENQVAQNKIARKFKKELGLNDAFVLFEIHKSVNYS